VNGEGVPSADERIVRVRAATIRHHLPAPISFGTWVIRVREFAVARVDSDGGTTGMAYVLTRDGPVREVVRRTIAPVYEGTLVGSQEETFYRALWSNHAVHAAGIGMRALSVVDLATWDLAARSAGLPIASYLGGQTGPMPATAIVGYPPTIGAAETAEQVGRLWAEGWRRFKLPIAPSVDASVDRLAAAREAAPEGWIGFDANMSFRSAAEVLDFERRVRHLRLGWLEDVVPPGDAAMVRDVRDGSKIPIAMGDDQGGSYHPEALLSAEAVDVLRVDATTNGGVTRLRPILERARAVGIAVSPHMYPHVHSRLLPALGFKDAPVEWGIPGTGVHPMDDGLPQPVVKEGMMQPLDDGPGFGGLVPLRWIEGQEVDDPDGVLDLRVENVREDRGGR
jgi:L-alanine-DL-glutamate epimerase-like enolase superfamily enzyme